jgi:hypothetical protein
MSASVKPVEYFYAIVEDRPGEAYRFLKDMASAEINLLAFNAIPLGMDKTEVVIFPEDSAQLARTAEKLGLSLRGPHRAFLIQGDDELGALVDIHRKLSDARVNVMSSSGVTDGKGGYGYLVYVKNEQFDAAASALGV